MALQYHKKYLCIKHPKSCTELLPLAQKIAQPCYIYDMDGIKNRTDFFIQNVSKAKVFYAIKSNSYKKILKQFFKLGLGADVVSGGEIRLAMDAGFSPQNIIFSGVGKTVEEIELGIKENILQFNVESVSELKRIVKIATRMKKQVRVAFRINPNLESITTHPYIKTGLRENKFGLEEESLPELREIVLKSPKLNLCGLTMHIGSQLFDLDPLRVAIQRLMSIYNELSKEFNLSILDVGGGLGLNNKGDEEGDLTLIKQYGDMLQSVTKNFTGQIFVEPGRILVGRFACLIGEVQYIKRGAYKNFIILNTGMHHLIRPCLYQAYHRILPLESRNGESVVYDVAGPVCESSDILGRDRVFCGLKEGDYLAILDAGAYGIVMASQYNAYPLPKEIAISQGQIIL